MSTTSPEANDDGITALCSLSMVDRMEGVVRHRVLFLKRPDQTGHRPRIVAFKTRRKSSDAVRPLRKSRVRGLQSGPASINRTGKGSLLISCPNHYEVIGIDAGKVGGRDFQKDREGRAMAPAEPPWGEPISGEFHWRPRNARKSPEAPNGLKTAQRRLVGGRRPAAFPLPGHNLQVVHTIPRAVHRISTHYPLGPCE
jgi:hypothetical protein